MNAKLVTALATALLLAGCASSTSTPTGTTLPTPPVPGSLADLTNRLEQGASAIDRDSFDEPIPVAFADIRKDTGVDFSGAAAVITDRETYTAVGGGFFEVTDSTTVFAAIGAATVTADATFGSVNVAASGFYQLDNPDDIPLQGIDPDLSSVTGSPIEGTLSASMHQVNSDNGYRGQLTGTLEAGNGDVAVNLPATGLFTSAEGDVFVASAFEDLEDPTMATVRDETYSVIIATRD